LFLNRALIVLALYLSFWRVLTYNINLSLLAKMQFYLKLVRTASIVLALMLTELCAANLTTGATVTSSHSRQDSNPLSNIVDGNHRQK